MLVVISDLHFTDGTTSNWKGKEDLFNVSPRAFKLLFGKISDIIERKNGAISKVTFVYNGDIFDPLRTHVWFKAPKSKRPWSIPLKKTEVYGRTHKILTDTIRHNDEALAWLSGTHGDFCKEAWHVDTKIDRIYIPGNHDRIINLCKRSRKLVRQSLLGQSRPSGDPQFKNFHMDSLHQSLVMHGHESDPFNCEFDNQGRPKYQAVPIGDPMTTMLFARLGYEADKLPIPRQAKQRFKDLDNVRPPLAGIRYIQDIIRDFNIGKKVDKMIQDVVDEFEKLPFYKSWQKKHDRWNIGFDEADKLQFALRATKLLGTSLPTGLLERLAAFLRDDSCEKWATRKLKDVLATDIRYCVLGHTHEPLHIPLCVDKKQDMQDIEKHYLNSGTFRPTFASTFDKQDFLRFQRMSFVIIYAPYEHDPSIGVPAYEIWSGLRMRH
jgi:hypothetical protein